MAGSWNYFVFLFLINIVFRSESAKLNVPRVLLPIFSEFSVNFTLEVTEGGCYTWTTAREDLISITPIDVDPLYGCSSQAVVSTISKEHVRNTAIVLAEEIQSEQILRCDVIVGAISSLGLITTTRELYVEEAPEVFEVRAYDDQGNEFSSLEGVRFVWSLGSSRNETPISSVLRLINFRDSPYETPQTVDAFELAGQKGHMVLFEGIKTGSAKVSVQLPHPEYNNVPAIEVQLMVVANLMIIPAEVYLLTGDVVHFRVVQVQNGRLEEIIMPSSQYFLELVNKETATLDTSTSTVTALELGRTQLLLHDRNVDAAETDFRAPTAQVTVAKPAQLNLAILPHRNWAIMIGEKYEIVVEVFDSDNHKFLLGKGVELSVQIPEKYFHVSVISFNKTYHYGWPLEVGSATVKATLQSVTGPTGKSFPVSPPVSTKAEMLIFQRISIYPPEVILPWDPTIKPKYEVALKAKGGNENFFWNSDNNTIAVVSQLGMVKTMYYGYVEISAAMSTNHKNQDICPFYILPPSDLEIVEYVMEAELGVPIYLHVAVYAERPSTALHTFPTTNKIPFTQCKDLPFNVKVWDNNFLYNSVLKITPVGISCSSLAIVGKALGTTKITVSYTREDRHHMEDSVTVATYRPLVSHNPENGETVLAVGTSRQLVFVGGPRPWYGRPTEHIHRLETTGKVEAVQVTEVVDETISNQDMYVYTVLCKELGEVNVTLVVTNSPPLKHCKRTISSASVRVFCAKPRYVNMVAEINVAERSSCPMNLNAERMVAQNYKDLEVTVIVKDEVGRVFDNLTSLFFNWKLSHQSLASVANKDSVIPEHIVEGNIILPKRHYQVVKPKGRTGVLELIVTVGGYQNMLKEMNIVPEHPPFSVLNEKGFEVTPNIKASMNLILVNDTVITPNRTTIFNHPKNKMTLQVSQGSGFYDFILSSDDVAEVHYTEGTRMIDLIPKTDGVLKIALVDLCLISKPAVVEVLVLGIGKIEVTMPDRVERGRCVTAIVQLYDALDNLLVVPDPSFLDMRAVAETRIISVKPQIEDPTMKPSATEMHFIATGLELGETTLTFITSQNNKAFQSGGSPIQVFPPLRIFPRNVTLAPGSVFQITVRGGPQPDTIIEYAINDGFLASVSDTGLVEGKLKGATTLTAHAIGLDKETGQRITYSSDTIDIHVVLITGIQIYAPITRLRTAAVMPVWAHGPRDQLNPLVLGSANPPIKMKWKIVPSGVASVRSMFFSAGLASENEDQISMRVMALKPGQATLHLNITVPAFMTECKSKSFVHFYDTLEIEVFETMSVTRPAYAKNQQTPLLVLAPGTQIKLKTNLDEKCNLIYVLIGQTSLEFDKLNVSKDLTYPKNKATVDQTGLVKAGNTTGRAILMVTASEDSGIRQTVSLTVVTRNVYYLMLNVRTRLYLDDGQSLCTLPKGLELELFVTYHDNTGAHFTSTISDLNLRTSRYDLLHMKRGEDNSTLLSSLLHTGSTMLKVWDDTTPLHAADYMKLHVDDAIFPAQLDHFTVGDVTCFLTPLVNSEGHTGTWATSNQNILNLDPLFGFGRVRQTGRVTVYHRLGSMELSTNEVEVLPIEVIKFLPVVNPRNLSNSAPDIAYDVPVVLMSKMDPDKKTNLVAINGSCRSDYEIVTFPYMCELRFHDPSIPINVLDFFAIYQGFDFNRGTYLCRILASGHASLNKSTLVANFSLYVISGNVVTPPLLIPFIPAFYLHAPDLILKGDSHSGEVIRVSGRPEVLDQIEVIPSDPNILTIGNIARTSPLSLSIPVVLNEQFWILGDLSLRMSVSIVSKMTYQDVEVTVKVHLRGNMGGSCRPSGVWNIPFTEAFMLYRHTFAVFISVLVIIIVTLYGYAQYLQPLMHPFSRGSPHSAMASMSPSPDHGNYLTQTAFSDCDPVYGDPRLYHQSPEVRRNRRYL